MGYRVSYTPVNRLRQCTVLRKRFLALWCIFFLLFLSLTRVYWPAGWKLVCMGMDFAQDLTGQLLDGWLVTCASIYEDLQVFAGNAFIPRKS